MAQLSEAGVLSRMSPFLKMIAVGLAIILTLVALGFIPNILDARERRFARKRQSRERVKDETMGADQPSA
ncbi:MAG TPA: hypothetical protein VIT38_00570 [Allosphingosinicella sp.]|jgi:hypothetical protein